MIFRIFIIVGSLSTYWVKKYEGVQIDVILL